MSRGLALDTNAYRALDDGNEQLATKLQTAQAIGLPIIVLGELYAGFLAGNKIEQNLARLDLFLATPRVEILQVDSKTARLFGEIAAVLKKIGKPIQQDDMWIAALCKQYGFALASRDKGFQSIIGLEVIDF